jgi:hypothetical protein
LAHSSAVIQCWKGVSWERERRGEERRERKEEEREERGERREERARIERLGIHEEGWREMLVPLGRGRFTSSHTSQKLHPSNCINWINKNLQAYKRKREEKKKQKNGNGKRDKKKVTWGCHPNALAYHAAVSLLFLVLMLTHWTLEGLMARINNSIECKWKSGRVEEWKSGRVEEWKSGRVEEWKSGRVEEWKRVEERATGMTRGNTKERSGIWKRCSYIDSGGRTSSLSFFWTSQSDIWKQRNTKIRYIFVGVAKNIQKTKMKEISWLFMWLGSVRHTFPPSLFRSFVRVFPGTLTLE